MTVATMQAVAPATAQLAPEYATQEEIDQAHQYYEELMEFDNQDSAWSVGEVWKIRPDPRLDRTNMQFILRIHRLARSLRQLQRKTFGVEIDITPNWDRRPDRAITECRLTIRWPRRPLVLEFPDVVPCRPSARGTSHRGGDNRN